MNDPLSKHDILKRKGPILPKEWGYADAYTEMFLDNRIPYIGNESIEWKVEYHKGIQELYDELIQLFYEDEIRDEIRYG